MTRNKSTCATSSAPRATVSSCSASSRLGPERWESRWKKMSSKKQTLSNTQAAKMLIKGADKTIEQIEKQGFSGIGKSAAFSSHKKPVCAFGWIVFHAGFLPLVEKHMEEQEKSWSEGIKDNNDLLSWAGFGYSGPATEVRAAL